MKPSGVGREGVTKDVPCVLVGLKLVGRTVANDVSRYMSYAMLSLFLLLVK